MALDSQKNREFKIVGSRPNRPDGLDKVTGRAKFGADAYRKCGAKYKNGRNSYRTKPCRGITRISEEAEK